MLRLLLILLVVFPAAAWADPAIDFQTEKHDFGSVKQGDQLEHTFEFSNTGSTELVITKVETS